METLELEKKKAIEAYETGSKKERTFLERLYGKKHFQKDVIDRIGSVDNAINELGESDIEVIEYRKLLSINSAEHIMGNQEAVIVAKALNEGWVADVLDPTQGKYTAWFTRSSSGLRCDDDACWDAYSFVGSRLCLKSSKLAKYFGEQFIETHKKYILKPQN